MRGWEKSPKNQKSGVNSSRKRVYIYFFAPARGSQAECDFALVISLSFYRFKNGLVSGVS